MGLLLHAIPSRSKNGPRHLPYHLHVRRKIDGESNAKHRKVATPNQSVFGWFKEFLLAEYLNRSDDLSNNFSKKPVFEFNYFRPSYKLHYKSSAQFRIGTRLRVIFYEFFCLQSTELFSSTCGFDLPEEEFLWLLIQLG